MENGVIPHTKAFCIIHFPLAPQVPFYQAGLNSNFGYYFDGRVMGHVPGFGWWELLAIRGRRRGGGGGNRKLKMENWGTVGILATATG